MVKLKLIETLHIRHLHKIVLLRRKSNHSARVTDKRAKIRKKKNYTEPETKGLASFAEINFWL